jgi:hypothetical protein
MARIRLRRFRPIDFLALLKFRFLFSHERECMQSPHNDSGGPRGAKTLRNLWNRLKEHPLSRVGPGLITGVADDDPSGIATYSQAGAQFGLDMLWTMPLAFPLMAAVQSMCARIGRVTGKGLAANIKTAFPPVGAPRRRAVTFDRQHPQYCG